MSRVVTSITVREYVEKGTKKKDFVWGVRSKDGEHGCNLEDYVVLMGLSNKTDEEILAHIDANENVERKVSTIEYLKIAS